MAFGLAWAATSAVVGQTVATPDQPTERYYKDASGNTIRETRRARKQPTWTTEWKDVERTVYRERYNTEYRDAPRTIHTPITEYRWEPRLQGRWNPFVEPYVEYRWVPQTRWELRTDTVRTPITRREWVQEKVVDRVPVTSLKMADEEVVSRVVVSEPPKTSTSSSLASPTPADIPAATTASRERIGGQRLDGDPPRRTSGWQLSEEIRR